MRCQARSERCEAIPWDKSPVIATISTARSHPADATHMRPAVGIGASTIGMKMGEIRRLEDEAPFQTTAVHLNFWLVNISANPRGAMPPAARGFSRRRKCMSGDQLNLCPTRECDCDERTM